MMTKKKLNLIALILIIIIIVSVILGFVFKEKLENSPSIRAIAFSNNKIYILGGENVSVCNIKGELTFYAKFSNTYFDDIVVLNDKIVLYSKKSGRLVLFDKFLHLLKEKYIEKYGKLLFVDKKIFFISEKGKKVSILDINLNQKDEKLFEENVASIFLFKNRLAFSTSHSNKIYDFNSEKVVFTIEKLSPTGTIINLYNFSNRLYFLYAGKNVYRTYYYYFDMDTNKMLVSDEKYYYPGELIFYKNKFYITDSIRNLIFVYSIDNKYLGLFGDKRFLKTEEKLFKKKRNYFFIGFIMNLAVVFSFLSAIIVYILSLKVKKDKNA